MLSRLIQLHRTPQLCSPRIPDGKKPARKAAAKCTAGRPGARIVCCAAGGAGRLAGMMPFLSGSPPRVREHFRQTTLN
ncbi:hypothetical protein [Paenibacillus glycanilyticus]|uniref:hypothetical protein n=1 Tax=Paenibacillus glycanilyticus TaxID=126569 RepID=UPI001910C2D8|nr:hypothetical protein [Paenibacillus glycanilyticus]